jgi:hypothetical protein
MSITEALAFIYIGTQADTRSGIWKGCAKSLSGEIGIPERTARDILEKMEHGDYIRRFAVPGRHSCYPILVHKFLITNGEHDGEQLNAIDSDGPDELSYFPCEQSVERNGEQGVEHGAAQKRLKTLERRSKETSAAKTAANPDGRFQNIVKAYFDGMKKIGIEPTKDRSDFGALGAWLKNNPNRELESVLASLRHAFVSTDQYPLRPGFRLREFLEHEAKFQRGPLLKSTPKLVLQTNLGPAPKNELTSAGAAKLAAYGVVS